MGQTLLASGEVVLEVTANSIATSCVQAASVAWVIIQYGATSGSERLTLIAAAQSNPLQVKAIAQAHAGR
ncbi:hypothetical protein ACVIGB_008621 [Bradyrhizobium sp. USDA 4341]